VGKHRSLQSDIFSATAGSVLLQSNASRSGPSRNPVNGPAGTPVPTRCRRGGPQSLWKLLQNSITGADRATIEAAMCFAALTPPSPKGRGSKAGGFLSQGAVRRDRRSPRAKALRPYKSRKERAAVRGNSGYDFRLWVLRQSHYPTATQLADSMMFTEGRAKSGIVS
jgi:hypothetical protein